MGMSVQTALLDRDAQILPLLDSTFDKMASSPERHPPEQFAGQCVG